MKKSIIAAGAASVALAAMPIVGAFAANTYDNITATISNGCTITDSVQTKTVSMSVAPGNVATSTAAPSISVTCNNDEWEISAVGSSETYGQSGYAVTDLVARNGEEGSYTYAHIPTNLNTTGTSGWAFKVASITDTTNGKISDGFNTWHAIPDTATTIVENNSAAASETVTMQYQVYAAVGQEAGAYNGQVTYTVTNQE